MSTPAPFPCRARRLRLLGTLTALATLASSAPAFAEQRAGGTPLLPQYRQECASCHVAYPPAMLPAVSWQRIVAGLPHHFGVDASLDPATSRQIGTWLEANAGQGRRAREAPPGDRITRSAWFVREHAEVPAATWRSTAVKSPSNCAACHTQADQGNFHEHDIRIPR